MNNIITEHCVFIEYLKLGISPQTVTNVHLDFVHAMIENGYDLLTRLAFYQFYKDRIGYSLSKSDDIHCVTRLFIEFKLIHDIGD